MHPRTPVIVGAAALNNRGDDVDEEPINFMTRAVESAFADAAAKSLRDRVQSVRVVDGIWPYVDPGRLVAERLGLPEAKTAMTPTGGNEVYDLLATTAAEIQNGELDVAVICAAETMRTRRRDRSAGRKTSYLEERDGAAPDRFFGSEKRTYTEAEASVKINFPVNFYALAEVALRHERGEDAKAHRGRLSRLWARASAVAASNPDAWFQSAQTAAEIATVNDRNRPIAYPYPKLMTANVNVDQAGAVVVCSAEAAEAAGVPRDRWVFVHAATGAADPLPTHRWSMCESPSMRIAGRQILDLAGVGPDDIAHLDLYSCFPVAVQVAQRELGIDDDRPFTITGGLTFGGGPLNSYCMQALTRSVAVTRASEPGRATTLLTGNGGFFSKHSFIVVDTEPPAGGYRHGRPQTEVDAMPRRQAAVEVPATATLETYTATYDRGGTPETAILSCLDEAGHRLWATTTDSNMIAELLAQDACGRTVALKAKDGSTVGILVRL